MDLQLTYIASKDSKFLFKIYVYKIILFTEYMNATTCILAVSVACKIVFVIFIMVKVLTGVDGP